MVFFLGVVWNGAGSVVFPSLTGCRVEILSNELLSYAYAPCAVNPGMGHDYGMVPYPVFIVQSETKLGLFRLVSGLGPPRSARQVFVDGLL